MYICKECGNVFDTPIDVPTGVSYGNTYEYWLGCPQCKESHFEEAHRCVWCDEWHTDEELYGGYCKECLLKFADVATILKWENCTSQHAINDFLMWVLGELYDAGGNMTDDEVLQRALIDVIQPKITDNHLLTTYVMENPDNFGEYLKKRKDN